VRFLQWKASAFYWLIGIAFGATVWIGKKTLLERILGAGLPEGVTVPASSWRKMSLLSAVFYLVLGTVNIWVALNRSESDWVTFKVWIAVPLATVFSLGVVLWLLRGMFAKEAP
jgi:intracellular septation protein